jgi:diguanylate cyclase (GGDEF)-like protein/PAS domain S-box-containing protein
MSPLAALWSDSPGFLPHGYCLAWDPALLWTIVLSHAAISVSYFSIPVALLYFVRRQKRLRFNWMFLMFGAFILGCGASHVIALIDIWHPIYRADASVLAMTGGVSLATALLLWPLVPKVSAFLDEERRNREELQAVNQRLGQSLVELEQRRLSAEESERLFRLCFERTPIGKALVTLDGRCLDVNQALCDILGYSEAELLGLSFEVATHPDDLEAGLAHFRELVEGGGSSYRMEKRYIHKSGRVIRAQLDVAILRDEQGRPQHFIAQVQDITERLQVQAELQQSKQRLEAGLARVQRQNEEISNLGELGAILHKCQNFDEMTAPMSRFGPMLFPGCSGALYLMHPSRNYLDRAVAFGERVPGEAVFAVNSCWALRRGQAHWHGDSGLECAHLHDLEGEALICAPMMAQGETIGIISLRLDPAPCGEPVPEARAQLERLAMMVADRVGIAIANVRLRETLRLQSIRDPLTGLLNRRYLEESLPRELDLARREQQPLAVLMIDVDHFKRFNDTHGHEAGDQALRLIGRQLMSDFRGSDIACRLGGEEFAVVMPRTSLEQARQRAEMLRQRAGQLSFTHHGTVIANITLSVGIACYPEHGQVMPRLVDAADQALYRAKRSGRNRVVCVESAEAPAA